MYGIKKGAKFNDIISKFYSIMYPPLTMLFWYTRGVKYILNHSLFVHMDVMQTHHVFSHVREDAKGKDT